LCLFSLCANAQGVPHESVLKDLYPKRLVSEIEFLVGPTIIYGHDFDAPNKVSKAMLGVCTGFGVSHQFNSRLKVNLRAAYEVKGFRSVYYSVDTDYNPPAPTKGIIDQRLNYASSSVLPSYAILNNRKKADVFVSVGPYVSYLLSYKYYLELYINDKLANKTGSRPDPDLYYRRLDAGITGAIGYKTRVTSKRNFTIQALYNFGLVDISKAATFPARNNSFTVLLGISLSKNHFLNP